MNEPRAARHRVPVLAFAAALGLVVVIWMLRKALAPFFLAMVLAYLQAPMVDRLARWMKRGWAAVLVILGSLGVLVLLLRLLVPILLDQVDHLITSLPLWKAGLETRWHPWLEAHPWLLGRLQQGLDGFDAMVLVKGLWGAGAGLLAGVLQGMTFLLVPVMIYYFLAEGPELLQILDELAPPRYRFRVRTVVGTIHERLGGYIRGQIAVALVMALLQGIALNLVGVPYAWLLGLIAGLSNVVPYSPYVTALLPALVAVGLAGAAWSHLAVIAIVFVAVQKAEALYFTPVWVGRASKLHPLEVLLAILCFGFAFGLPGLIFAVPLMIVVKVITGILIDDYKAHPWFQGQLEDPSEGERKL